MTEWPDIETRVEQEATLVSGDDPETAINLFQEDRVAIIATTRINGQKAVAMQVLAPGVHRQVDMDMLVAQAEPSLRRELDALIGR